jgi:hypothetical protein
LPAKARRKEINSSLGFADKAYSEPCQPVNGKRCLQKTLGLVFQHGRIQAECMGGDEFLLKFRERKIQREHSGMQEESAGRESIIFFFRCF